DLILSHDGKKLHRSEGYTGGNSGDRQKYLNALAKVDSKYAVEGQRLAKSDAPAAPGEVAAKTGTKDDVKVVSKDQGGVNKLVPDPVEPRRSTESAPSTSTEEPVSTTLQKQSRTIVALDGFCPVTLRTTKTWTQGNKQFAE